MYFLLIYKTVDDYVARRQPFRAEHLEYAEVARARGELFMGGALGEPADTAILIIRTDDRAVVEDFARRDPYVRAGLVREWAARPWTVAIGP